MRVTFNLIRDGLSSINTAADTLARAQEQVASGRMNRLASDDPSAAQRAIGDHAELAALDSFTKTNDAVSARQSAVDSVLSDVIDKLTAALGTVASAQGTTATQAVRDAAAGAIQGIRDGVLGDINSNFQGTALFSGSKTDQTSYVLVGGTWTYQGDNTLVQASIERGRNVAQTWDGQAILQGSDPANVLTVLDNLATAITAGDAAGMTAGMTALQQAFGRATQAQSRLGADENSVADARTRLADLRLATDTQRSKDEDVNLAEAATRMSQAQVAYRAALSAVAQANQQSLLDYLK